VCVCVSAHVHVCRCIFLVHLCIFEINLLQLNWRCMRMCLWVYVSFFVWNSTGGVCIFVRVCMCVCIGVYWKKFS